MIRAIAILGPTASGKSRLGMALARRAGGEILSVDSRQSYRHLDIGTAKPSMDDRRAVPHHLIDTLELHEKNDAARYARMAREAVRTIVSRGALPIFVGGSGLYFRAITHGFFSITLDAAARGEFARSIQAVPDELLYRRLEEVDPGSARRIHPNDRYRIARALEVYSLTGSPLTEHLRDQRADPVAPDIRFLKIGLEIPRAELHRRIEERTLRMFDHGWRRETEELLSNGVDPEWPGMKTLGYPQVVSLIRGEATLSDTLTRIVELTRQYAKRQTTWFRKEPAVAWLRGDGDAPLEAALELMRASAEE